MVLNLKDLVDTDFKKWCKDHFVPLFVFILPAIFIGANLLYPDYKLPLLPFELCCLAIIACLICCYPEHVWKKTVECFNGTFGITSSEDTDSAKPDSAKPSSQILRNLLVSIAVLVGTVITGVVLVSLLSMSGIICAHANTGSETRSPDVGTLSDLAGGQATAGDASVQKGNFVPNDQALPDMQGNLAMEASTIQDEGVASSKCKKVNREDHRSLSENHLLNKFRYGVKSDVGAEFEVHELNLVQSLADQSHWKDVAVALNMSPSTILDNYRETEQELMESSRRLFDKIYDRGYDGKFTWDAYIDGFKETGVLQGVVDDLVKMLECIPISISREVSRNLLYHMTCDKGGTHLNLIDKVAHHWRAVARTFKINEHFIFANRNVPELSASTVLRRLYDSGYKGKLGWQGVLNILRDTNLTKLYGKLDRALNCMLED